MEAQNPTDKLRAEMSASITAEILLRREEKEFLKKEAKLFATQIDLDLTTALYRSRHYSSGGECFTYYEECRVVERKPTFVVVISQDFNIPGFYKGGKFQVKRDDLNLYGVSYHSRHGDYFCVARLSDSSPLPNSAVLGGFNKQPEPGSMVLGSPHR